MAYSTTYLYPEDLNGNNPQNLITNEPHTLQTPGPTDYYFIIPKAAPFFVDSLIVINAATNQPYVEGDDYQVGHLFIEAMDSIGRPIAGSIRFMRPDIVGQVKLTYRTIGGAWGFSDQAILRELSNKHLNPLIRTWGDIDVLPYSFPPLPHDQRINTLVGSEQINETLEKIAEIMEATAEGTSKSHIDDHNNPHEVTKFQVGLGNVPNFAMATDQQHLDATRNDLFTNPRGVLLLVNRYAVEPLTAHIDAKGNVHDMVPADIGLGNVPNWLPATPQTAIDPTNNSSFMTPYTTALLVQKLQNDPRLDQLIIDFNEHITADNPHHITPLMIGTYTSAQIDAMIDQINQGGDAVTFGGQTPDEWEDKFPAVADINDILQQLFEIYAAAVTELNTLDVEDPVTPEQINQRNATRASWVIGEYDAYAVYSSIGAGEIVSAPTLGADYPDTAIAELPGKWSTSVGASYYVHPDGSVSAWGANAITIPVEYRQGTLQAGFECQSVYASKDFVYLYQADNRIFVIPRSGAKVLVATQADIASFYINNGLVDPRVFSAVEVSPPDNSDPTWLAYGDASWITAFNNLKTSITSAGQTITDLRIGSQFMVVLTESSTEQFVRVYSIVYGASITLTNVSGTTAMYNHATGTSTFASAVRGITQVSGAYKHFVFTKPIGPDTELCDIYSFGDDSDGQLEIPTSVGPFIAVGAGFGFTVTVDQNNFTVFWGNTPDNSLQWRGGKYIDPTLP